MAQLKCVHILLIAIIGVFPIVAENPGLQIEVRQSGLDEAVRVAMHKASAEIRGKGFRDVSSGGSTSYSLTNMKVNSFSEPQSRVSIDSSSGVKWIADNAAIQMTGNWRYKKRVWFFTLRDSGSFRASLSNVDFTLSAKLDRASNGVLRLRSTGCTTSMNKPSIHIGGTFFSFIYNIVLRLMRGRIRSTLQNSMCTTVTKAINTDLNGKLSGMKFIKNIDHGRMLVDYSLVSPPVFGPGYLRLKHKGEIRSTTNPAHFNVAPSVFPDMHNTVRRMVYIWGSDKIINSFTQTAFNQKRINSYLRTWNLGDVLKKYMRTKCPGESCFGTSLPELGQAFANAEISLNLTATHAPIVKSSASAIEASIPGEVTVLVKNGATAPAVPVISFSAVLNIKLGVTLSNSVVKASVQSIRLTVTQIKLSSIGSLQVSELQPMLNKLGDHYIIPKLNELGQAGLELPQLSEAHLIRPVLKQFSGGVMFAADIRWI